jgi:hypothetical protein
MFREIVNEMADLYEKKNANYGDSFGQLFDALGPVSGLVPLHNKLDRATSLIKGNKNNFESLEDTFKDLACYAIMNLIEMKVRNQKITSIGTLTTTPGIVESNPNTITTPKDPCATCPWKDKNFGNLYVGDIPCQWCEHGTKVTCGNIDYCTATVDNTDNIKLKADPSIVASTMIDEYYDLDDLTVEEMAKAEREEIIVLENIYGKYMTRRGDK